MRSRAVVFVLILTGCQGSSAADTSGTASSVVGPSSTTLPVDGHPLSELLPASVSGVATQTVDMSVADRNSPRAFLKVVARLGKTPPESELAFAYASETKVYAVRVAGVSGNDVLVAFVAERVDLPTADPKFDEFGGKQVIKIANTTGSFLYASADVMYTIEAPDEPTALDVLQQLPAQ